MNAGMLLAVAMAAQFASASAEPQAVAYMQASFRGLDGVAVSVDVFTIDATVAEIRVVDGWGHRSELNNRAGLRDIRLYAQGLRRSGRPPTLTFSGGNIVAEPNYPLGWVVEDGVERSHLDQSPNRRFNASRATVSRIGTGAAIANQSAPANRSNQSPPGQQAQSAAAAGDERACQAKVDAIGQLFGGVLCVADGVPSIRLTREINAASNPCRQAIQSRPVLIHPGDGSNGVCRSEIEGDRSKTEPARRGVACVDTAGRLKLVLASPTYLYPLAEWMRSDAGLACKGALNLIGDYYAAAIFQAGSDAQPREFGNTYVPQASAIVVYANDTIAPSQKRMRQSR